MVVLAGCFDRPSAQPMPVESLLMPIAEAKAWGVEKIELKSVLTERGDATPVDQREALKVLGQQGIWSSAYVKYWRADNSVYKLRITAFLNDESLQADWLRRYPPATLQDSVPLEFAKTGFRIGDKAVAFQSGLAWFEIQASGGAGELIGFARGYKAFLESKGG